MSESDIRDADFLDAIIGGAILPGTISKDQLSMARILEITPGESYVDAMTLWVDTTFMFEGLPGFDGGLEMGLDDLAAYLERYGIDPYDDEGKAVITHFLDHALNEWYGDFYQFNNCSICGKQFQPKYDLEYAYQVLDGYHVLCPACQEKKQ